MFAIKTVVYIQKILNNWTQNYWRYEKNYFYKQQKKNETRKVSVSIVKVGPDNIWVTSIFIFKDK